MKRIAFLAALASAAAGVILYMASALGQADGDAAPIYGIKIPAGYRDWRLISVKQLAGNKLKQLRAQLGNDLAIQAFREGKVASRTAQSLPRCIGMRPPQTWTTRSWPPVFPAPALNRSLRRPP
jgi:hypothetical protein